ncbi:NAD+ synthase [Neiella marina]|uniref:Glutamine-dependent NAD(+) synthetase n=1 Tax=Neiella marina TaxID=508461 RepID=A0A8J2U3G3_9GAMM|nr:NAD+ synthase [Neiella marina]GGA70934.1 NAD+ synthase [Neiella marina]
MLNIAMGQIHCWVGDIEGNGQKVLAAMHEAAEQGADIILFPELTLTGYPPEDLLLRDDLYQRIDSVLAKIKSQMPAIDALVGLPTKSGQLCYNSLVWLSQGEEQARYHKQQLPNYGVFDEKRYFQPGTDTCVIEVSGHKLGLLICEDVWHQQPAKATVAAGAELLLIANASPYHTKKTPMRHGVLERQAAELRTGIVYVNHSCGQDELIFDGQSVAINAQGKEIYRAPAFETALSFVHFDGSELIAAQPSADELELLAEVYKGLTLAVRDYVTRNGFAGAVLGLSGGIDSALTLAIAADALGADKVQAVMMPFRYTSEMSIADAAEQAELMGVEYDAVSIEPMFDAFMQQLEPMFKDTQVDTTEENLQARSRGVVLMALSNKRRRIVLTTGNKSEMAVGYATLYGDMCGGFAVLKDVPKTMVFDLARYRNTLGRVIPERVITRPPSAELAPDQVDSDSLPDYADLDDMIERYVEQDASLAEIVAAGYDEQVVRRVIRLIDMNEYKRRQSAVGPRITPRGFAKDRRNPICSGFGRANW